RDGQSLRPTTSGTTGSSLPVAGGQAEPADTADRPRLPATARDSAPAARPAADLRRSAAEVVVVEEHVSPDGRLRFLVVTGEQGELTLGFAGFAGPTHADIRAALPGLPEAEAVRRYVSDLVGGESVIVLWSVGGELRDVWVSDDPAKDAGYA